MEIIELHQNQLVLDYIDLYLPCRIFIKIWTKRQIWRFDVDSDKRHGESKYKTADRI